MYVCLDIPQEAYLDNVISWPIWRRILPTQLLHRMERLLVNDLGEDLQSRRGLERRLKRRHSMLGLQV